MQFFKTHSIFLVPLALLLTFVGLLTFWFRSSQAEPEQVAIESGLSEIKLIQVVGGKEQEINITETPLGTLRAAIQSNERFDTKTREEIQQVQIDDVVFPTLPEQYFTIVDNSSTESIEKYLQDVYTVFNENQVNININKLVQESLNEDLADVEAQLEANRKLYLELFAIEVPRDALPLHKKYLRITQIQHHFLNNLLTAEEDPLKVDIDIRLAMSLLDKLNEPIRQDLKTLSDKYQITYDQEI